MACDSRRALDAMAVFFFWYFFGWKKASNNLAVKHGKQAGPRGSHVMRGLSRSKACQPDKDEQNQLQMVRDVNYLSSVRGKQW